MKIETLTSAEFLKKVLANEPVIAKGKDLYYSFINQDNIIYIFPLAFATKDKESVELYEVGDDVIFIDGKKKRIIANDVHDFTIDLNKALKKKGYKEPYMICDMCPLDKKCVNNIKELLRQIEDQPCIPTKDLSDNTKDPVWIDQLVYLKFKKEIESIKKEFDKLTKDK